jgi:hypothetical protein
MELRTLLGDDKMVPRGHENDPEPRPYILLRSPDFNEMAEIANLSQGEVGPNGITHPRYGSLVAYCCRCVVGWGNAAIQGKAVEFVGVRGPSNQVRGPTPEDLDKLTWPQAQQVCDRIRAMMDVVQRSLS